LRPAERTHSIYDAALTLTIKSTIERKAHQPGGHVLGHRTRRPWAGKSPNAGSRMKRDILEDSVYPHSTQMGDQNVPAGSVR
jgi:hypothetical protein